MAKKVIKKRGSKKSVKRKPVIKKSVMKKPIQPTASKMSFVWKRFVLYLLLAIVSYVLSIASSNNWSNMFLLLALLFGFVALALLIVVIAIWIIRKSK